MSSKPNAESFVAILKKSGLVEADRLQKAINNFTTGGGSTEDSNKLAEHLIANGTVTRWQAEKLLQGKHKGYFLGKYRLLSLLGKGGMSSVYLAEHTLMRRRCALKVLPTKRVHDSSYLARFHREAQAVASLDHPNIVRAYDVDHQADRDNEIHFLVMEYVEGDSLQDLVQKNGVCSFLDAAEFIRQSALGLHNAHEAGMVHRDVKPGNLLVDVNGTVKVLDLGLARFFTGEEDKQSLTVAHDEKVLGTADYLAPEQALDSHTVDARADIYGLGCTLYFLLAGRPPFVEGTLAQRLMAHQAKTPPLIESLRTDTPASLATIVRKMMAKKPEDRHATAKETAEALFGWIDDNADEVWRKSHSDLYGTTRKTGSGLTSVAVPVAKPILAVPVVAPVPPAKSGGSSPVVNPVSTSKGDDAELSNFFASMSGSQPKSAQPVPPLKPVVSSSLSFLKQPPHLASKSTLKLPVTAAPQSTPTDPVQAVPAQPPIATASGFPELNLTTTSAKPTAPRVASLPQTAVSEQSHVPKAKSPSILSGIKALSPHVLAGVGGGSLVLLFLVIYLLGGLGDANSGGGNVPLTKWPDHKREITVGGSKAEYKTIVDALKAVRVRYESRGNDDQMVIKIAAGMYKERISIDGSVRPTKKKKNGDSAVVAWPEGIKLVGEGTVILNPTGNEPVIRLKQIPRFVIEGIEINASGKPTAIELSGYMPDTSLRQMTVRGFTEVGVSGQGLQGSAFGAALSDEVVLDTLRLEPAATAANAIGIRLQEDQSGNSSYVIIRGGSFQGPMAAGIALAGSGPYKIAMAENLFYQTQDGIRFEGPAIWKDLSISNNTFCEGKHGLLFTKMPGAGSGELTFRRNLFTKMSAADGLVQANYDEGTFYSLISTEPPGVEHNYSDRDPATTPIAGEINPLFAQNGKRGEKGFAFAATDPKQPKFLGPSDKSVQRKVDLSADAKAKLTYEKPWVGAVGP